MQIGTYEVLRELGRGGMGTVYLARALGPGGVQRLVAIKRPHEKRASASEATDPFLEEARITAHVHHANVVGMHQAGADDDGYFLVFDYVEGESLGGLVERARRRDERIPEPIVIRIVLDALAGLHAAHEARGAKGEHLGILHRDVSPQNLLIGRDGVTRLTDFGIAKITASSVVTDQRYVRGKFAFMSPEYLQRLPVDRTLDVYAMGVTLWIALTGTGPWNGYDELQLIQAILLEGVPPLTGVPEPLAEVVNIACRSDAGQRFQTARQMLEALEAARVAIGSNATHFDVAEYLERVAGAELDARREAIAPLAPPSSDTKGGAIPAPDTTEFHWQQAGPSQTAEGPDTAQMLRDLEPRRSRAMFVYAALGLSAVGALFAVMNRSPSTGPGGTEAPRTGASVAPVEPAALRSSAPIERSDPPEPATAADSGTAGGTTEPKELSAAIPGSRKPRTVGPSPRASSSPAGARSSAPFLPFDPQNPYR